MPVHTMATLGCSAVKVGVSFPRVAAPTPGMGLLRDGVVEARPCRPMSFDSFPAYCIKPPRGHTA